MIVNLRSDTFTLPTAEMKDAMMTAKGTYEGDESAARALASTGEIYMLMGDLDKANQILKEIASLSEIEKLSYRNLALLYFVLGYEEEGFNYLEKAYEAHLFILPWITMYQEIDQYRSDPRFTDFLKKMELIAN